MNLFQKTKLNSSDNLINEFFFLFSRFIFENKIELEPFHGNFKFDKQLLSCSFNLCILT